MGEPPTRPSDKTSSSFVSLSLHDCVAAGLRMIGAEVEMIYEI